MPSCLSRTSSSRCNQISVSFSLSTHGCLRRETWGPCQILYKSCSSNYSLFSSSTTTTLLSKHSSSLFFSKPYFHSPINNMFTQIITALALASAAVAAPFEKRTSGTASKSHPDHSSADTTDAHIPFSATAFFYQGGNAGSCGTAHSDSDKVVALPSSMNPTSHCGETVYITRGDKSITAIAADTCPSCSSSHIDLSVGAFTACSFMIFSGSFNPLKC